MKKTLNGTLRVLAFLSLLAIPLGFVLSGGPAARLFESVLKVRVDPRLSGGEIMATIYDPAGDDKGAGGLLYPTSPRFGQTEGASDSASPGSGALDILKYVVYEPSIDAPWSGESDFWQLAVKLAALPNPDAAPAGFSLPAIRIYIDSDSDGEASGSAETRRPRSELVDFDPAFAWDIALEIEGWRAEAKLFTAGGTVRAIKMIVVPERQTIWVRLPLDLPEVKRVLDGRATRHYVLTLASDPVSATGVMPVRAEAGNQAGGGATSTLTPRIYDLLATEAGAQTAQLSSWDEGTFTYARLEPVTVQRGVAASGPRLDLDALARAAKEEAANAALAEKAEAEAALAVAATPPQKGVALFRLQRFDEAEALLRQALAAAPVGGEEHASLTAYLGSLTAMKGGRTSNPAEAVTIVNEAFALLDAAVEEAGTIGGECLSTALMNRASVAASVPNEVFRKAAVASQDFSRVASLIAAEGGQPKAAADAWLRAALAMEISGGDPDGMFLRAAGSPQLSAWARYELAKRGFAK